MKDEEKLVRDTWEDVALWDRGTDVETCLRYELELVHGRGNFFSFEAANHSEAWTAASVFTAARLEEIRLVQEEIAMLERYIEAREKIIEAGYDGSLLDWGRAAIERDYETQQRILVSRLEALAELRRGMKEQA